MINGVYTSTQEHLNKDGRGILSPARFMLFAEGVQIKIQEDVIHDYDRARAGLSPERTGLSRDLLEDVMDVFSSTTTLTRYIEGSLQEYHSAPSDFAAWGDASIDNVPITKVPSRQKALIGRSSHIRATEQEPVCYKEGSKIYVIPDTIGAVGTTYFDEVSLTYFRTPIKPNWTYTTVLGKAVFNESASTYQDFELPYIFFDRLVIGILAKAGLHIRDEFVVSQTNNEEKLDFTRDNQR